MKKKLDSLSGELYVKTALTLDETMSIFGGQDPILTHKPTGTDIINKTAGDGDDTFPVDG